MRYPFLWRQLKKIVFCFLEAFNVNLERRDFLLRFFQCVDEPLVAFLQDPVEVKKLMKALGIRDFRAPPPIPEKLAFDDGFIDQTPHYDA